MVGELVRDNGEFIDWIENLVGTTNGMKTNASGSNNADSIAAVGSPLP